MKSESQGLRARLQGVVRTAGGARWCVWGPRHSRIHLVLGMDGDRQVMPMSNEPDGYHSLEVAGVATGLRYAYRPEGAEFDLPDPASRWQPDGVHRPSAVFFPDDYEWHDQGWQGVSMRELAIYELHVGTFTAAGTFAAAIPRLPQLKELGITAIEIMPVAQFPGTRNWGYDGVHPYATQNSYGGPRGLQELVDAAHQLGLGVILDVVYNHLGPEGNYLAQFGPYFTNRYHTPWGSAFNYDGPDSDPVRSFVIENACQWVRDFHIDGLRLDAVQTIYDLGAFHLLAELRGRVSQVAAEAGRSAVVIAETNQNDSRITASTERGGYDLDGVWSDDFHHSVHSLLTQECEGYYVEYGEPEQLAKAYRSVFVYDGCYSSYCRRRHGSSVADQPRERFIVSIQNHDQIGNRALGDRFGTLISPAAQRLAAALLLLSPNTPMLFMGEEYGETNPFPFFCSFGDPALIDGVRQGRKREFAELAFTWRGEIPDADSPATYEQAKLSWRWSDDPSREGLRRLYQALLEARRSWSPLVDRQHCAAQVVTAPASHSLLVIERGRNPSLIAIANLSDGAVDLPKDLIAGRRAILSTSERQYGGHRSNWNSVDRLSSHELIIWGDATWK